MKRVLVLVLALALAATLFTTAYAEAEKSEIEYFCVKQEVQEVMQEIIDDFMALNPDIAAKLTYTADGETVLLTRIASGDVPDVISLYPAEPTYKKLYDEGYLTDLTNEPFMANVEDAMLAISDYNGVQFSLPYTLSTYGVYYREDAFEKAGIAKAPETIDELIAAAKACKDAGYDGFTLPLADGANQIVERTLSAFDPETYKEFEAVAAGEKSIRDVPAIKAFAELMLALQPYSTADALGLNGDGATSDFANGVAAMRFNGSWFLSSALAANPELQLGMFPIPSDILGEAKVPVNIDSAFSISASAKAPEACLKFLDYLSQAEVAQKFYEVDGNINMIKGVTYDKAQLMDLYERVMAGNMSLTQINLWGENPTNVRRDLGAAFQALMIDGDLDAYYDACEAAVLDNY